MSYTANMSITYQTVVDENGEPTAAQIPWDEFKLIREAMEESDEATPEEAEAIAEAHKDRAEGNEDAFKDLDEFMSECKS
jgi:PHD/YefM family antitoxin component YafN of YafNO toxin-antitoxin module